MGSKSAQDMTVEQALSLAIAQLGAAIDQVKCWCVFDETKKRKLTAQQQAARRKYDELLAARIVLVQEREERKRARVLSTIRPGTIRPGGYGSGGVSGG